MPVTACPVPTAPDEEPLSGLPADLLQRVAGCSEVPTQPSLLQAEPAPGSPAECQIESSRESTPHTVIRSGLHTLHFPVTDACAKPFNPQAGIFGKWINLAT